MCIKAPTPDLQRVARLIDDRIDHVFAAVPPRLRPLIPAALLKIAAERIETPRKQPAQNEAQAGRRMIATDSCAKRVL